MELWVQISYGFSSLILMNFREGMPYDAQYAAMSWVLPRNPTSDYLVTFPDTSTYNNRCF